MDIPTEIGEDQVIGGSARYPISQSFVLTFEFLGSLILAYSDWVFAV
jgi:hypothetical protein